jgi:hypothetical protein
MIQMLSRVFSAEYALLLTFFIIMNVVFLITLLAAVTPDTRHYDCINGEIVVGNTMWPLGEYNQEYEPMLLRDYRLHCENRGE